MDGLRAVAFLMVFGFHYLSLPWGWAGVDIFFVLSGFLITGILFDTRDEVHRVRNFYVRRTLRIFPLYYGVFLLIVLAYPLLRWKWNWVWLAWPLYLGGWSQLLQPLLPGVDLAAITVGHLQSSTAPRVVLFLGHFWTLCIEEQFYLVWPWVVFWIKDRRRLIYVCLFFLAVCPILRVHADLLLPSSMVDAAARQWFTPFRIDALLLGGLLALVRRGPHAKNLRLVARLGFAVLATVALLWIALEPVTRFQTGEYAYPSWEWTWGLTFVELLGACVLVMALEYGSLTFRILNLRPLRWLGRISYGAYVIHDIPKMFYLRAARHTLVHWRPGCAALGLGCTLLVAWASFRWLETPFIRLKARWID